MEIVIAILVFCVIIIIHELGQNILWKRFRNRLVLRDMN